MIRKGFTILEVLLIVVAISILLTAAILLLDPVTRLERSRDQQRELDIQVIQTALTQYTSLTESEVPGITDLAKEILHPDAPDSCDPTAYVDMNRPQIQSLIRNVPVDPQVEEGSCGSGYFVSQIGESFIITAPSAETKIVTNSAISGPVAVGGEVSTIEEDGETYRIHIFNESGELTLYNGGEIDYLVVAGGGGGGGVIGGGGGGGGLLYEENISFEAGTYQVVVGQGGMGGTGWNTAGQEGRKGQNSQLGNFVAEGGGGGGAHGSNSSRTLAVNGGSGGGGSQAGLYGTGVNGQGFRGGTGGINNGGGGGGAGAVGTNALGNQTTCCGGGTGAGNGGVGLQFSISGESLWYSGGGGGGTRTTSGVPNGPSGTGGLGGGGNGTASTVVAQSGMPNTGGGGGAAGITTSTVDKMGGDGGSGVVIVRYPI